MAAGREVVLQRRPSGDLHAGHRGVDVEQHVAVDHGDIGRAGHLPAPGRRVAHRAPRRPRSRRPGAAFGGRGPGGRCRRRGGVVVVGEQGPGHEVAGADGTACDQKVPSVGAFVSSALVSSAMCRTPVPRAGDRRYCTRPRCAVAAYPVRPRMRDGSTDEGEAQMDVVQPGSARTKPIRPKAIRRADGRRRLGPPPASSGAIH